jgi:hypothetical protein
MAMKQRGHGEIKIHVTASCARATFFKMKIVLEIWPVFQPCFYGHNLPQNMKSEQ